MRLLILILLFSTVLSAQSPCFHPMVYSGLEGYYLERTLETGTHQSGSLYGVRFLHERIRPMCLYWAAEGHWARGQLSGTSSQGRTVASDMTDVDVEGRLGWTFRIWRVLVTPLVGVGYFNESNDLKPPTPIAVLFRIHFGYLPIGFVSRVVVTDRLSIGLDAKVRYTWDGQENIYDPELGDVQLNFDYRTHYTVDVPIRYRLCNRCSNLEAMVVVFWRQRHYGRRFTATRDLYDTRINLYGARLMLGYLF